MRKRFGKTLFLFFCGGIAYGFIELLWRGYTHWTMLVLGGVLFVLIGGINNYFTWDMSLVLQCLLGSAIVTGAELVSGIILNIWLGLGIWDYSHMWGNVLGQICPQFTLVWIVLSGVAIFLDDCLRYTLWGEPYPHYILF